MKYFVLGAVSSAILLYGISLIYGVTGSLNLLRDRAGDVDAGHERRADVRHHAARRGTLLQDRGGAVSRLDAGRL